MGSSSPIIIKQQIRGQFEESPKSEDKVQNGQSFSCRNPGGGIGGFVGTSSRCLLLQLEPDAEFQGSVWRWILRSPMAMLHQRQLQRVLLQLRQAVFCQRHEHANTLQLNLSHFWSRGPLSIHFRIMKVDFYPFLYSTVRVISTTTKTPK